MDYRNDISDILLKLNQIKTDKKISLENISSDINKDKTVTSRILNGKYNLDLLTFLNICYSLDVDPVSILDSVINPNVKRITINDKDKETLENMLKIINDYENNNNNENK